MSFTDENTTFTDFLNLTTHSKEDATDEVFPTNSELSDESDLHIALKVIYAVIGTLGLLGNGLVCAIFLTQKRSLLSITNLLILNQSIIDLFNTVVFLSLRLPPAVERLPDTVFGELLCRLWFSEYLMWSLFFASTMNLVLVSLERYFAILFPVKHRFHFTSRRAKTGMAFSWFWGFTYQLYWLIIRDFKSGVCGVAWSSATLQKIMGVVFFLMEFLLPLVVMTFAYASIIVMLRRRGTNGRVVCNIFQRAKRNVTFTLCLVFFFYVVCWTPTEATYFLYNLGYPYNFNSTTHMIVTVLVLLNMCVNPIIYTLKYEQFQKQLKVFVCSKYRTNRVGVGTGNNSSVRPGTISQNNHHNDVIVHTSISTNA